ncbi:MAG: dTDP-glucose 4,6-dehydratase [Thermodesulfobacteriota bacterium]|nr:dTDP-glucose 4,6-dehydratase [Thermodesulfobacteriota bacterium]
MEDRMKNILVTGGSGFIGTNFVRYLLTESDFSGRIVNVDNLTYAGNPENLRDIEEGFPKEYIFIKADICDPKTMSQIFKKYRIDTICHFAAESHVDRSIVKPDSFIHTNIIGTFTLLEIAKSNQERLNLFHHISTDEVFGSLGKKGFFTEKTAYRPNSPYSASKAGADHLVRAYHKTYGLPVTISNCSNNYGPYQFPEKLIPLVILNAKERRPIPVYGDGKNIRDWLYVRDHCVAIWEIMKNGKRGEAYNIGGGTELENIRLIEMICDLVDQMSHREDKMPRRELITFVKDRPGHDKRYAIDATKIKNAMGWAPEESFETGIRKTINWYMSHKEWVNHVKSGEYRSWIKEHYR